MLRAVEVLEVVKAEEVEEEAMEVKEAAMEAKAATVASVGVLGGGDGDGGYPELRRRSASVAAEGVGEKDSSICVTDAARGDRQRDL